MSFKFFFIFHAENSGEYSPKKFKGGKVLNGFEAISYYNGWAQAIAGILIVMTGLSFLALIISQLYKVVNYIESFGKKQIPTHENETAVNTPPDFLNADLHQLSELSRPYVEKLGDSFQLRELYDIFQKNSLPHPHLTIKSLREGGQIVPLGDGVFCWNR